MSPVDKTEFGDISDVLDSEIADVLSELAEAQNHANPTETHFCRAHAPLSRGIVVLLKCQRVSLFQEKRRTRIAAAWSSGVAAFLVACIEVARRIIT